MYLDRESWTRIGELNLLIIPTGSTEQHGPHLPLSTDSVIAYAVASRVAARLERDGFFCVVAPVVTYGSSGEHQDFPGTLSIGNEVLTAVLMELVRSGSSWAPAFLFVNGHGGNAQALSTACEVLQKEGRYVSWVSCEFPDGDAHAGHIETSLMLALDPAKVGSFSSVIGERAPLAEIIGDLRTKGVRAVSPLGVLGDPRSASVEVGNEILSECVERVSVRTRQWLEGRQDKS